MNRHADLAANLFLLNRLINVIAQDNSSTHTSKALQIKIPEWERKGLFLFQLPPY